MNLWFISLSIIGCCFILKYGAILDPIRDLLINKSNFIKDLFKCSLCLGFWIGFIIGIPLDGICLTWAFYSAAICWFADHLIMIAQNYLYPEN